jgi:hypothetical protein
MSSPDEPNIGSVASSSVEKKITHPAKKNLMSLDDSSDDDSDESSNASDAPVEKQDDYASSGDETVILNETKPNASKLAKKALEPSNSSSTSKKKAKSQSGPPAKKKKRPRAASGYATYYKEVAPSIKSKEMQVISPAVSKMWHSMTKEEKQPYLDKAAEAKAELERENRANASASARSNGAASSTLTNSARRAAFKVVSYGHFKSLIDLCLDNMSAEGHQALIAYAEGAGDFEKYY